MAVFPDRIVLKNSTDAQAAIESAIGSGGTDAIVYGEVVIGRESGGAKLYTLDSTGAVVVIGGGAAALGDLTDVDLTTTPPVNGNALLYNGAEWVPGTASTVGSLDDLTDVDLTTTPPVTGDYLKYNGSQWVVTATGAYDVAMDGGDFDTGLTDDTVTIFDQFPISIDAHSDVDTTTVAPTNGQTLIWDGTNWVPGTASTVAGLDDLTDVTITSAATGEVLRYNGSAWVDAQLAYSDLSGTPTLATVATSGSYSDLTNKPTIPVNVNDLGDVTITGAVSGQILEYNGSAWVNVANSGGGGATSIDDLTDVDTSTVAPTNGQVLKWNGSNWVPDNESGGGTTLIKSDDPYWQFVSNQFSFDGATASGAYAFTDVGNNPQSLTNGSVATINQSKWGTSSLDASAGSAAFAINPLGEINWTLEGWFYYDNATRGLYDAWIAIGDYSDPFQTITFERDNGTDDFSLRTANNSVGLVSVKTTNNPAVVNTWQHIAVCRDGDVIRAYLDGVLVATMTGQTALSLDSPDVEFGVNCKGINDVRLTRGVARYTGEAFELPTQAFDEPTPVGGGGGGAVQTAFVTEAQTASGGAATFTGIGKSGQLVQVTSSLDAWIVLYPTAAARTADAGRSFGTDPAPGSGVLAEFYITAGGTVLATPGTVYFNNDTTKANAIYAAVRDQAGASVNSEVTLECYAADGTIGYRTTLTATTSSLANDVAGDLTFTETGKSGRFISIATDRAAWVTLYTSTAARTADSSRPITTDPSPGSGVLAEVLTAGAETVKLTPAIGYFNDETVLASELYAKVVNKSGATSTVQVDLTVVPAEA